MKFLSRKAQAAEPPTIDGAQKIVHREIEIRVEREWISVGSHIQPESGTATLSEVEREAEELLELPTAAKRE